MQCNTSDAGRSGTQGSGDVGCTPGRDRGMPAAPAMHGHDGYVAATGTFPWTAQCRDGLATHGDVVASGKTVKSPLLLFGEGTGKDREQRSTGTGGERYPHDAMRHTRTAGRPQGRGVAGSGTAAAGGSSAGLCASAMWRGTPPEGETGDLSFTVVFLHDTVRTALRDGTVFRRHPRPAALRTRSSEAAQRSLHGRFDIDGRQGRPLQGNNTTIG
ncbi:MAG: hypothetical protein KFH87_00775 [Bacteroidetes bacterium]|nr:hypothetical protein [Bacteroidota bacterium]